MTAATDALKQAHNSGLRVSIADSGNLWVEPLDRLTPTMCSTLAAHKVEILEFLREARNTVDALVAAAHRASDCYGDDDHDRAELIRLIENAPASSLAGLSAHFQILGLMGDPDAAWLPEAQPSQENAPNGRKTAPPKLFSNPRTRPTRETRP